MRGAMLKHHSRGRAMYNRAWAYTVRLIAVVAITLLSMACVNDHDLFHAAHQQLQQEIHSASGYRQIRAAETLGEPQANFPIDSSDAAVHIGQLRVRIAAGQTQWIPQVLHVALNPDAPGHVHALEASAKLRLRLSEAQKDDLRQQLARADAFTSGYILWLLAENDDADANAAITNILAQQSDNRLTAAYAAGFLRNLPPDREQALRNMATTSEPLASSFATLALARHQRIDAATIRQQLANLPNDADEKAVRFLLVALGEVGSSSDLPLLRTYLNKSNQPELTNAAAGSILNIGRR